MSGGRVRESQEATGTLDLARQRAGDTARWRERERLRHLAYSCTDFTLGEPRAASSLDNQVQNFQNVAVKKILMPSGFT